MGERRTIGQILMSFGRITEDDVARALEHQKENGGYFGEALLALGYVSGEELEWGLAAQFDLPYVFPEADTIDPEAAALVSPEWALAHLTLPIIRTADSLTVIVDSPIKTEAVDQLQARTDLRIELALASAAKIRELIRKVYSREEAPDAGRDTAMSVVQLFSSALAAGSTRFGISIRGAWANGWYEDRGTIRRVALAGHWRADLEGQVQPPPSEHVSGVGQAEWRGQLAGAGGVAAVDIRYLAAPGGAEYLFRPADERATLFDRFSPPTSGIVSEVRLLAGSGAARFIVTSTPTDLLDEMLPYLPALLFDASWRSVHLSEAGAPGDDVFSIPVGEGDDRTDTLTRLRAFHFDVATADLSGPATEWARAAADVATVAFVRWRDADTSSAADVGLRWQLHLESTVGGQVDWSLQPLK